MISVRGGNRATNRGAAASVRRTILGVVAQGAPDQGQSHCGDEVGDGIHQERHRPADAEEYAAEGGSDQRREMRAGFVSGGGLGHLLPRHDKPKGCRLRGLKATTQGRFRGRHSYDVDERDLVDDASDDQAAQRKRTSQICHDHEKSAVVSIRQGPRREPTHHSGDSGD